MSSEGRIPWSLANSSSVRRSSSVPDSTDASESSLEVDSLLLLLDDDDDDDDDRERRRFWLADRRRIGSGPFALLTPSSKFSSSSSSFMSAMRRAEDDGAPEDGSLFFVAGGFGGALGLDAGGRTMVGRAAATGNGGFTDRETGTGILMYIFPAIMVGVPPASLMPTIDGGSFGIVPGGATNFIGTFIGGTGTGASAAGCVAADMSCVRMSKKYGCNVNRAQHATQVRVSGTLR